jgi:hypothetical protein
MAATLQEKTVLIDVLKNAKATVSGSLASSSAETLGKQIDDLTPATSTANEIIAAYDAYRNFRLPSSDSLAVVVTTIRADVTP